MAHLRLGHGTYPILLQGLLALNYTYFILLSSQATIAAAAAIVQRLHLLPGKRTMVEFICPRRRPRSRSVVITRCNLKRDFDALPEHDSSVMWIYPVADDNISVNIDVNDVPLEH